MKKKKKKTLHALFSGGGVSRAARGCVTCNNQRSAAHGMFYDNIKLMSALHSNIFKHISRQHQNSAPRIGNSGGVARVALEISALSINAARRAAASNAT